MTENKTCNIMAIRTFIKNRKRTLTCEWCGEEIQQGKEYRVYGEDSRGKIIKVHIHVYCESCWLELIPEFFKWKNEGT
jgi:hypothetical protein